MVKHNITVAIRENSKSILDIMSTSLGVSKIDLLSKLIVSLSLMEADEREAQLMLGNKASHMIDLGLTYNIETGWTIPDEIKRLFG